MSAALEFTPAVCVPVPETAPAPPRLRVVGEPAPDWCPRYEPLSAPDRTALVSTLHPPRESGRVAPLRLTRRGVVVLSALVAAVGGALLWVAALSAAGASTAAPAVHGARVTVRSGDTLWSIASRVAPDGDPRAEVAVLQHANHLADEQLTPGQTLRIP